MVLTVLVALLAAQPPAVIGPPVPPPRPTRQQDCSDQPGPDGEMVVCGERYDENSPYRIPREFRGERSDDDVNSSWAARVNDEEAIGRFGDGFSASTSAQAAQRQRDCKYRADRQIAQGRRPDCGARSRRDSPDDYRRRSGQ